MHLLEFSSRVPPKPSRSSLLLFLNLLLPPSTPPLAFHLAAQTSSSSSNLQYLHLHLLAMFGLLFPERTYPMDPSSLTQIDPTHWILDLTPFASPPLHQVCVFLLSPSSLPPNQALSVYFQPSPTHAPPFLFCGALTPDRPSAILTLPWPADAEIEKSNIGAKIGVCVEDLTVLPPIKDEGEGRRGERMALKVGESLFNYMQSFCGADGGGNIVVPADILDRWFRKFQERARKDPNYLKGFDL